MEVFDSGTTFGHYFARLVSSYALSSLADRSDNPRTGTLEVGTFLERVKAARAERFEALGEGEDLRLSGEALAGGALQAEERIVHLAAFDTRDARGRKRPRNLRDVFVH
jgi:hypothetical protein